jgi:hypothetical protein
VHLPIKLAIALFVFGFDKRPSRKGIGEGIGGFRSAMMTNALDAEQKPPQKSSGVDSDGGGSPADFCFAPNPCLAHRIDKQE